MKHSIKRLVVDDIRVPQFEATLEKSPYKALDLIRQEPWDEVWFDHDNGYVGPDYSWVTDKLEKDAFHGKVYPVGLFILHSANWNGRLRMLRALEGYYKVIHMEQYPDRSLRLSGLDIVPDASVEFGQTFTFGGEVIQLWYPEIAELEGEAVG